MQKLYEKCVPAEERERIKEIVAQEEAMRKAEEAASHRFVFIEAKKNGVTSCRIGEGYGTPLEVALSAPVPKEKAMEMTVEQYGFCPDIDQNFEELGALADTLRQSTVWYFWWD